MKKEEIAKKRIEALKMYLLNKSKHEISNIIHVSEHTLLKWEKQGNWRELYDQATQKVAEKVQSDIIAERERSLKLIHGAESIIAQKIQNGELEGINVQALASLVRAKSELINPKSIVQANFIRQEIGPTYRLEIITSNDNKNAIGVKKEISNEGR
mgnify:CR=1 FL=1